MRIRTDVKPTSEEVICTYIVRTKHIADDANFPASSINNNGLVILPLNGGFFSVINVGHNEWSFHIFQEGNNTCDLIIKFMITQRLQKKY